MGFSGRGLDAETELALRDYIKENQKQSKITFIISITMLVVSLVALIVSITK